MNLQNGTLPTGDIWNVEFARLGQQLCDDTGLGFDELQAQEPGMIRKGLNRIRYGGCSEAAAIHGWKTIVKVSPDVRVSRLGPEFKKFGPNTRHWGPGSKLRRHVGYLSKAARRILKCKTLDEAMALAETSLAKVADDA